jgi:hypothetical protein
MASLPTLRKEREEWGILSGTGADEFKTKTKKGRPPAVLCGPKRNDKPALSFDNSETKIAGWIGTSKSTL